MLTLIGDVTLPIAIAVIGFGGSVVVAVATLAGIWITMRNERERQEQRRDWELQRWRSELKLESYADLIRTADDFRKAATDLRGADSSSEAVLGKRFEEQSHLLDRAASRVNFVGSANVQAPLHALVIYGFTKLSNIATEEEAATDAEWSSALGEYFRLYDALLLAARDDLGLEPIPRPIDLESNQRRVR